MNGYLLFYIHFICLTLAWLYLKYDIPSCLTLAWLDLRYTWLKNSWRRHSSHGSATSMGRHSFEMSATFNKIIRSWERKVGKTKEKPSDETKETGLKGIHKGIYAIGNGKLKLQRCAEIWRTQIDTECEVQILQQLTYYMYIILSVSDSDVGKYS